MSQPSNSQINLSCKHGLNLGVSLYVCMYVCILYLKINSYKQSTLASSTKVGFHEGRRIKKNYLQGIYKKIGVTLVNTKDKR